jgi:glycosyltransferase involved in cell wall biosynthesis
MGANRRIDLGRHVLIQGDERSWAPLDQVSAMVSDAAWQRIYVSEHLRVALQAPGVVVPDGVDVSMFTPGEDAPERDERLIGCIVHPSSEVKNTDIVLDAASEMGDECKLLAVVAAPELEGDERISRICSDVVWGPVHKSDIARAMFRCGAWLVPSTEEGFGIVGLEAMLAGCVLITAAPGGMKTYVRPDENAIRVFNPRSQAQWMNMMRAYLGGKPEDLAEVRRRAREMAEGFSISRSATLFLDAITSSSPSDPDSH